MRKEGFEMLSTDQFKEQIFCIAKKLLSWTSFALLSLALFHLYFFTIPSSNFTADDLLLNISIISTTTTTNSSSSSSSFAPSKEEERDNVQTTCDYSNGKWVPDKMGSLYNGTSCGTISDAQNCMTHGRPDLGYLNWRWKPHQCNIPRFEPLVFLQTVRNKRLAFVGDSMSRNQVESLICMLSTGSSPRLVYSYSDNDIRQKFRRWYFLSHNVSVSAYWSPFLVHAIEKTDRVNYDRVYLDSLDERWASYLDQMDMIVLSVGHWFLQPAVYFLGNTTLGCHMCTGQKNYTEVGLSDVFGKILKITLDTIVENRGSGSKNGVDLIMTTFSPRHFEGEQEEFGGACPKTQPFEEGEKQVEGMDAELRRIEVAEMEAAKETAKKFGKRIRLEVLDVTKLSLLRGDGHPGPYLFANPFANGTKERVQNDCVNWCLPGPVDTWNEILLSVMKRWDLG